MMLGASILAVVVVALMGSFFGQSFLNENARNLTAAMNDATRIMEQIRQQNTTAACVNGLPSVRPPGAFTSWNDWLNTPAGGGPKSVRVPDANQFELIAVTCQDEDGGTAAADYCGSAGNPAQIGTTEWSIGGRGRQGGATAFNPIRVTVGVGWLQQRRVMGSSAGSAEFQTTVVRCGKDCTQETFQIAGDTNNNGVVDSQAMLTTLVTCR